MENILPSYLILGAILFCIGIYGALSKKSAIVVLLSIELMLSACILNFVAFAKYGPFPSLDGQIFALFIIAVAAVEVAVGIAILIVLFRGKGTSDVIDMDAMKH